MCKVLKFLIIKYKNKSYGTDRIHLDLTKKLFRNNLLTFNYF